MPVMTSVTSAPTRSQIFAISLAKPIFSARNALAEYLIISALVNVVLTRAALAHVCGPRRKRGIGEFLVDEGLVEIAHHQAQ